MWDLPPSGTELCFLHWQVDYLPLSHQGNPREALKGPRLLAGFSFPGPGLRKRGWWESVSLPSWQAPWVPSGNSAFIGKTGPDAPWAAVLALGSWVLRIKVIWLLTVWGLEKAPGRSPWQHFASLCGSGSEPRKRLWAALAPVQEPGVTPLRVWRHLGGHVLLHFPFIHEYHPCWQISDRAIEYGAGGRKCPPDLLFWTPAWTAGLLAWRFSHRESFSLLMTFTFCLHCVGRGTTLLESHITRELQLKAESCFIIGRSNYSVDIVNQWFIFHL